MIHVCCPKMMIQSYLSDMIQARQLSAMNQAVEHVDNISSVITYVSCTISMLYHCFGAHARLLQPIVLPSLMLKPANVTHLRIEEDLIYTSVHQALGFDHSCSCSKGVFGRNCITRNFSMKNGGDTCFCQL